MALKKVVYAQHIARPAGVWSPAILVTQPGKLLFISGPTARDETGVVIHRGDIRAVAALP